jgi:lipoprotein-anchoring transpeptidase ErfK/SrfK
MVSKIALALAVGTAAILTSGIGVARAEMVYNVMEQRWEDIDLTRRQHMKGIPAKYNRRSVLVVTKEEPGTIVIDTNNKFLYHITGAGTATRYGVGVGREGFGWSGIVSIGAKQEWPTWNPPAEMIARERAKGVILPASMKGGPENPLGARAMYLYKGGRDTIYRIHGTNQPWSIGLNLSSGCIRMMNKDVEHLYSKVGVGTKVIVVGPGQSVGKHLVEGGIGGALTALLGG